MTARTLREPAFPFFGRPGDPFDERSGTIVVVPSDGVQASLRRVRRRPGSRFATYALEVENTLAIAVESATYAFSPDQPDVAVASTKHAFPAQSASTAILEIVLPRRRNFRVVSEIRTDRATLVFHETIEPRRARALFLPLVALAFVAALALAFLASRPGVATLRAPERVEMGRTFTVGYDFDRASAGAYTIHGPDGIQLASGQLFAASGAFELAIPTTPDSATYTIRVVARNGFGEMARAIAIEADPAPVAVAAPAPVRARPRPAATLPPLRVTRLAIDHDTVVGGASISVNYEVPTTEGSIRLIDQYGTVRAESLLDRRGNSIVLAPFVDQDQDFKIVLHASRRDQQVEASLPVRITKAFSIDDFLANARREKKGPIVLVSASVASGDPIRVAIVQGLPDLHLSLTDEGGREIGNADVPSDQNLATFTAPSVATPEHYTISATFKKGVSEETLILPLVVGVAAQPTAPPATTASTPEPTASRNAGKR